MEGSERRARARIANKPARYFDDDDSDEPPVKRARDGGGEKRRERASAHAAASALGPRWGDEECHTFFESFKKHGRAWSVVAEHVPGRDATMCEALFNLNKSFLSLPIDAINGVALSAMMRDHYNNLAALGDPSDRGKSRPGSVRGTPSRPPRPPSRRESPARTPTSAAANGAGGVPRVVGRRTPRHGAPRRLTSEKAADDADALEMAGAALVSMSPGGMAHSPVRSRDDGDARRAHLVQQPFGSPTPSPGRRRGEKKGRALFPPEPAERGAADDDEEALGALDGLFMLADASASAGENAKRPTGAAKRKPSAAKPPRGPTPVSSPARRKGGGAASPAFAGANSVLLDSLRSPASSPGGYGAHTPGTSRKSVLKSTPPMRLRDGVRGGGYVRAPSADVQTPGVAQLTRGLGRVGPKHLDDDAVVDRGVGGVRGDVAGSSPAPPSPFALLRVAQSAPRRRWFLAEHFYSSIDRPWFVTRLGYGPFLEHLGLADAGPFSKKDRTTIRRALGKPRRLSLPFLRQERVRLERWRRSVRAEWETMIVHASTTANAKLGPPAASARGETSEAPNASVDAVKSELLTHPADPESAATIPAPLRVGDRVVARHPRFLNVNTGSILTSRDGRCRVQFDRLELGVELVKDVHIAHLPPHLDTHLMELEAAEAEAEAEAARATAAAVGAVDATSTPDHKSAALAAAMRRAGGLSAGFSPNTAAATAAATAVANAAAAAAGAVASGSSPSAYGLADAAPETAAAIAAAAAAARSAEDEANASEARVREDDARALAEVTRALELKESLVVEIRHMNDLAERDAFGAGDVKEERSPGGTVLEPFQRQYAQTMLKIREANTTLAKSLVRLREQHEGRERSSAGMWRKFAPGGGGSGARKVFDESEETKSAVAEANAVASAAVSSVVLDQEGGEGDGGLEVAAEIVSASTFSAAARIRETRSKKSGVGDRVSDGVRDGVGDVVGDEVGDRVGDGDGGGDGGGLGDGACYGGFDTLLAKAIGSVLAFQTCSDHGVDPALTADVMERFVSSIRTHCTTRAARDALNEVSAAFESLKALL